MFSRLFLLLTSLEGFLVIWKILQSPSEAGSARLFGLSTMRLMLLGVSLLVVLLALGLLFVSFWKRSWYKGVRDRLKVRTENRVVLFIVLGLSIIGSLVGTQYALYAPVAEEPVVQAFLLRLQPFLIWLVLICGQLIALLFCWHFDARRFNPFRQRNFWAILAIFGFFLMVWVWLAKTGYGFAEETPERGVFRYPGTPILGVQVVLAVVITLGIVWLWNKLSSWKLLFKRFSSLKINLMLGVMIWIAAFAIWMSAPLEVNWFADIPRPPNYTFSPNSDAYLYEAVGQSLLVGSGFWHPQWGPMVPRPMYSAVLALFHLLGGSGYEAIIPWQVAFLAIFPALVFYLTSVLHNRISGVLAALLVIMREYNAISLADTITVSHAKVLMADLPATLGGVLFLLLVILWVKNPGRNGIFPLLAGGTLGFFLMIRLEVWALLAIFALAGLCLLRRHPLNWIKGSALAILGFSLMVAPWVWRNWQLTHRLYIISPKYERMIFDKLLDMESDTPTYDRAYTSNEASKVTPMLVPLTLQTDGPAPGDQEWSSSEKLLHHYFNSQVQSFLYLPMSPSFLFATVNFGITRQTSAWNSICCSSEEYVRDLPYWWGDWDGSLAPVSYLAMGMALFVVSVGISTLWNRHKFLGLLPMFTGAIYIFFLAVLGRSGGRWIQEVDWISMVVYSIGLVEIIFGIVNWVNNGVRARKPELIVSKEMLHNNSRSGFTRYFVAAMLIFLIGSVLPFIEIFVPQRFTQTGIEERVNSLLDDESNLLSEDEELLLRELLQEDVLLWSGRALYPRYFESGEGMEGLGDMYKRPFSRMEFFLVGTENHWSTLAQQEPAEAFPHAADVLLIGRRAHYSIEVVGAVVYDEDGIDPQEVLWSDSASSGHLE